MSKRASKLGRNPLGQKVHPNPQVIRPGPLSVAPLKGMQPIIEKIKELQIQVDWEELYRATVENKLKDISRFFLRF